MPIVQSTLGLGAWPLGARGVGQTGQQSRAGPEPRRVRVRSRASPNEEQGLVPRRSCGAATRRRRRHDFRATGRDRACPAARATASITFTYDAQSATASGLATADERGLAGTRSPTRPARGREASRSHARGPGVSRRRFFPPLPFWSPRQRQGGSLHRHRHHDLVDLWLSSRCIGTVRNYARAQRACTTPH